MSNTPSGLQTDRFVQSFTKSTAKNVVYTTEDFVNTTVKNYLNTSSSVNIRISGGVSMDTVTGTTETIVTIGLSASLHNLNDVSFSTPATGDYLKYNGSEWSVGPGLSITDASITDLNDVTNSPSNNSILFSANGSSMFFKEDKGIEIDNLQALPERGLVVQKNSSYPYQANIQTRFLNFPTASSDTGDDFYTFTNSVGVTKKIKKNQISPTGFSNFTTHVQRSAVSAFSASNFGTGGYSPGLSYNGNGVYNLNLTNYLSGSNGILPISHGGTCATNAVDARVQLGLSYRIPTGGTSYVYDIMGFKSPSFRENLEGDGIRLIGKLGQGLVVYTGGANYIVAGSTYYITDSSTGLCYGVSITTGGTSVISITIPAADNGTARFYSSFNSDIYSLGPTFPTSKAGVSITVTDSYITYGTGGNPTDNFGLRFGMSTTRVKRGTCWEEINIRPSIGELPDVTPPFSNRDILVYDGTSPSFKGVSMSGVIGIGTSGNTFFLDQGISFNNIDFGVSPAPVPSDFGHLTGTTGNIQLQLDGKLSYTGPVQHSDIPGLLILEGGTCNKTTIAIRDHLIVAPQIPVTLEPSFNGISFMNVASSFKDISSYTTSDISKLETCLVDTSFSGNPTGPIGTRYSLPEFMNLITATGGGLAPGTCSNTLQLSIENLPSKEESYIIEENMADVVAIGPSIGITGIVPNHKLSLQDLLRVPGFSDSNHANTLGYYFTGAVGIFNNQLTLGGVSMLGVATGNGTSWYGVSFSTIF